MINETFSFFIFFKVNNQTSNGYLSVKRTSYHDANSRAIVDAWKELGLREIDYNTAHHQLGVSQYQTTSIHGTRLSSNGAFLRGIRAKRRNLTIKTKTRVIKIMIDRVTKKTLGVEYSVNDDRFNLKKVYASKEVILSAGAFASPKLLMLSGIGHADELLKYGIDVVEDLPVGDNLHDHVMMPAFVGIFDMNSSTVVSSKQMQNDAAYWLTSRQGKVLINNLFFFL